MTTMHRTRRATPPRPFGETLPPVRWHKLLVTAHVVTAVGLLGLDLALVALGIASLRGAEAGEIYPVMHLLVEWLMMPLALAALGTGVLLARGSRWGLFRFRWVAVKLVITVALTVVLFLVLAPALETAATTTALTESQRRFYALAPAASAILLSGNVALAVYKPPGTLIRFHRSSRRQP